MSPSITPYMNRKQSTLNQPEDFRCGSRSFAFLRRYDPERIYTSLVDNKNTGNGVKNTNMVTIPHQHQH